MNSALLADDIEIIYRKNHFKYANDVFNTIISCSICNADLKPSIFFNENIMMHKKFLCLCCKDCFNKLSDLKNGCALCSTDTKIQTCTMCKTNICQKCIDRYFSKSTSLKKACFICSPSVLWNSRSQAAAILKSFVFDLDKRLLLNGRKSGDQQNLHTFLVNNAKCDENFNPENIYQIQINYLSNLFKTKIQPLIGNQEQSSDFDQCSNDFHDRCQQVLFNTLSILLELKSVLNEKKNTKSLHDKMKLILSNKTLFNNNTLNNSDQNQIDFHYNNYILDHQSRLLAMRNCSVSLVKLDEEIVKLYSSKKGKTKDNNDNSNLNPVKRSFKSQLKRKNLASNYNNVDSKRQKKQNSSLLYSNLKECRVLLSKLDSSNLNHLQKYKEMMNFNDYQSLLSKFNEKSSESEQKIKEKLDFNECYVCLTKLDEEVIKQELKPKEKLDSKECQKSNTNTLNQGQQSNGNGKKIKENMKKKSEKIKSQRKNYFKIRLLKGKKKKKKIKEKMKKKSEKIKSQRKSYFKIRLLSKVKKKKNKLKVKFV